MSRDDAYLAERFQAWDEIVHQPRFNVAPTQPVVTIRGEGGKRRMSYMRWGLISPRATHIEPGNFNARAETVMTTKAFRHLMPAHRCLIPADGFYEWQQIGRVKQPFCFEVDAGEVFAFAGLWDEWKKPDGQTLQTCTILTTAANSLVAEIHDRMPVILAADKYDLWLDSNPATLERARASLLPYDAAHMRRYPVSTRLNNSRHDDADSARRVEVEPEPQGRLF